MKIKKKNDFKEIPLNDMDLINGGGFEFQGKCFYCGNTVTIKTNFQVTGTHHYPNKSEHKKGCSYFKNASNSCLIEGTLLTLPDGSYKKIEDISLNDYVLTWNLITGKAESRRIIANHIVEKKNQNIIYATFSDETTIALSWEHGFFDITKSKYVYFREDAAQFIGDSFVKMNKDGSLSHVVLKKIEIKKKTINVYSPISDKNLCIFTNDLLSITGGSEEIVNIFDVNSSTLKFDEDRMNADILKFGLLNYSEVSNIVPKYIYDNFQMKYFKVAIGKGNLTMNQIEFMLYKYADIIMNDTRSKKLISN